MAPAPLVAVRGPGTVDVSLNRVRGSLAVNLVNTSGAHWDTKPLVDSLPPVGPLELAIRTSTKPARVTLQPEGQSLPFEYQDRDNSDHRPRGQIHAIVLISNPGNGG